MLELKSKSGEKKYEQVELFSIDDKSYSAVKKPRAAFALKVLKMLKDREADHLFQTEVLLEVLGEEGYNALTSWDELEPEHIEQVFQACLLVIFGSSEEKKEEGESDPN